MLLAIQIIQVILSVTLVILVLVQTEGSGLGGSMFGAGEIYHSKRGIERTLFIMTIVVSILFTFSSAANVILS